MKKLLPILLLFVLSISACGPQAAPTQESIIPEERPTPTRIPVDLTPAQRAAIAALSETLNLAADKIKVVSTEAVTWPNGCLGVQRMGVMCTQALVEGFKIVLEAGGKQYEYHTNQDGTSIVAATSEQAGGAAEDAIVTQLAQNLGLDKKEITVVSSADVEFPDACMGVAMPDVMCAQMVTPGRIIVLEAKGVQYEYHTSADGSRVQPATLALTWKREGGIAGFCDSLTVFLSGEVYTNTCKGKPEGRMGTLANLLSAGEREQFSQWTSTFGQETLDASDPAGVADRMVVTLSFYGSGSGKLATADKDALFTWVQDLFQKLNK